MNGSEMLLCRRVDPVGLPEVLVLDEAATLLGWTLQATYEAARDGTLPVATFGDSPPSEWRFLRDRLARHRGLTRSPEPERVPVPVPVGAVAVGAV